ncbi:hypothetical protein DFH09DRAFT_1096925 [Mycena vulgaris]|nr:hypothetical protein DFH09DRAFT_1096925 [Mycena vulgaris]
MPRLPYNENPSGDRTPALLDIFNNYADYLRSKEKYDRPFVRAPEQYRVRTLTTRWRSKCARTSQEPATFLLLPTTTLVRFRARQLIAVMCKMFPLTDRNPHTTYISGIWARE